MKNIYKTKQEFFNALTNANSSLCWSDDLSLLKKEVKIGKYEIKNSLAIHPVEGCDGNFDGSPAELTFRRYKRFAEGGSGLIWYEATSVVEEGRGNPRQLFLHKNNVDSYKKLIFESNEAGIKANKFKPFNVLQLTHSGRFSKPKSYILYNNPFLNKHSKLEDDYPFVSDDYLKSLPEKFAEAALLAKNAGFDGVDIKACHCYLFSELLSAYTRKGNYGGSFENRIRLFADSIDAVRAAVGDDILLCSRVNLSDVIEYPYGFGMKKEEASYELDFEEPLKMIKTIQQKGISLINITMGTPYYNPHVNRPYDSGGYEPSVERLKNVERIINAAGIVKKECPDIKVVSTGFSWLKSFAPFVAAGQLASGDCDIVGFGREAFAYPDFANDIFNYGEMNKSKLCVTCSKCTELMRGKKETGCVVRDKLYTDIYTDMVKGANAK